MEYIMPLFSLTEITCNYICHFHFLKLKKALYTEVCNAIILRNRGLEMIIWRRSFFQNYLCFYIHHLRYG